MKLWRKIHFQLPSFKLLFPVTWSTGFHGLFGASPENVWKLRFVREEEKSQPNCWLQLFETIRVLITLAACLPILARWRDVARCRLISLIRFSGDITWWFSNPMGFIVFWENHTWRMLDWELAEATFLALSVADDGWRHPVSARGLCVLCTAVALVTVGLERFATCVCKKCFNALAVVSFGHSFVVCCSDYSDIRTHIDSSRTHSSNVQRYHPLF